MYGSSIYFDKEQKHGVRLKGLNFNIKTIYHQGYFNETTREDKLEGKLSLEILRNTNMQDYEFFGKPNTMPNYENRELSVLDLPQNIKDKMIDLWSDIEKELSKSKPLFKDAGKGR